MRQILHLKIFTFIIKTMRQYKIETKLPTTIQEAYEALLVIGDVFPIVQIKTFSKTCYIYPEDKNDKGVILYNTEKNINVREWPSEHV